MAAAGEIPRGRKIHPMLVARVNSFLADPAGDRFEELALAAFAFQYERIAAYRRLCDGRGVSPANVSDWRQVPPVPALAMKRLALHADEPLELFRSSGSTAAERSTHYLPYPDLYRQAIDCSFPRFCLPQLRTPAPMLALVPERAQAPDSSLDRKSTRLNSSH